MAPIRDLLHDAKAAGFSVSEEPGRVAIVKRGSAGTPWKGIYLLPNGTATDAAGERRRPLGDIHEIRAFLGLPGVSVTDAEFRARYKPEYPDDPTADDILGWDPQRLIRNMRELWGAGGTWKGARGPQARGRALAAILRSMGLLEGREENMTDHIHITLTETRALMSVVIHGVRVTAVADGNMVVFSGSPTGRHQVMDDPPGRWKSHWEGYLATAKEAIERRLPLKPAVKQAAAKPTPATRPPRLDFRAAMEVVNRYSEDGGPDVSEDPLRVKAAILRVLKDRDERTIDRWLGELVYGWRAGAADVEDILDIPANTRRKGKVMRAVTQLVNGADVRRDLFDIVYTTSSWLKG